MSMAFRSLGMPVNPRRLLDGGQTVETGRKLTAHKSCVNSLSFSRNGGRWLASAGDGKLSMLTAAI